MRLIRFALLMVIFFLTLGAVIGIAEPATGIVEKLLLVAAVAVLLFAAGRVRGLGKEKGPGEPGPLPSPPSAGR